MSVRHETAALIDFLAATPRRAHELVRDLAAADLRYHPRGEEWSIHGHHRQWSMLQHLCHLDDLEQEGYGVRIQKFLNEPQPFFPDIDGDRLAMERDYDGRDALSTLAAFERARARSLDAARPALADGDRYRATMEGAGTITLSQLLEMMRTHDDGHLQAMERLRVHLQERARR